MIPDLPSLDADERRAIRLLLGGLRRPGMPPLRSASVFGSKARGDADDRSDIDVLVVCDVAPAWKDHAAAAVCDVAERVQRRTGVDVETWTVLAADLLVGRRTPMLIDALADSVPLWPPGQPAIRLPFTPRDAHFCADCLLDWVAEGGGVCRAALREGRWGEAAGRARDDITRLATAALLLTGDTRHRRTGSLERFRSRFVERGRVSAATLPALAWASAAFPADGGRGRERPPVSAAAVRSADLGYALAGVMEREVTPWILGRMRRIRGLAGGRASP
jgi:predicted nucleotidyltransferase